MPITTLHPMQEGFVTGLHPLLGTPGGSIATLNMPFRVRALEFGFSCNSALTSATTLAVQLSQPAGSTASTLTLLVASTAASFSSTNLYLGAPASTVPTVSAYFNEGDTL